MSLTMNLYPGLFDTTKIRQGLPSYQKYYTSPEVGLKNRLELWRRADSTLIISIRGTVAAPESWLENFYAPCVPAQSMLSLPGGRKFNYKLAQDERAQVHTGWLLGLAYLVAVLDTHLAGQPAKQCLIIGHSQGGALALMLAAYIKYNKPTWAPATVKVYGSAAPKVGNQVFAADLSVAYGDGLAYRIVNSADWVPESPFSIQTLPDFAPTNPFQNVKPMLKGSNIFVRAYVLSAYNKMDRRTRKAAKVMRKYLGKVAYKQVAKTLPGFDEPTYTAQNNYSPAGQLMALRPTPEYLVRFPLRSDKVFMHHDPVAYMVLLKAQYPTYTLADVYPRAGAELQSSIGGGK